MKQKNNNNSNKSMQHQKEVVVVVPVPRLDRHLIVLKLHRRLLAKRAKIKRLSNKQALYVKILDL